MKKIYAFLAVMAGVAVSAQPVLTSASLPSTGNNYGFTFEQNLLAGADEGGANQTWTFPTGSVPVTINYITVANSSLPSTFTDANVVESISIGGTTQETFFDKNSSGLNVVGQAIPGFTVDYSNPREFVRVPMTMGDTYTGNFAANASGSGLSLVRSGSVDLHADGYGNVVMPYGTVQNAIKVTSVFVYDDVYMGVPIADYIDTIRTWWHAGTGTLIASYTVIYTQGSLGGASYSYIDAAHVQSVGVEDFIPNTETVHLYPNPANDRVTLTHELGNLEVRLFDLKGSEMLNTTVTEKEYQLDVSTLTPGLYFLHFTDGKVSGSRKLLVK